MRRTTRWIVAGIALVAAAAGGWLVTRDGGVEPVERAPRPVIFVHGMSASAATMGTRGGQFHPLLPRIAEAFPRRGVCQDDAEPRPWGGSPCVFRYVGDRSAEGEPGADCPCDSQSGILENARKLAEEVSEVSANAGGERVILVGYSMGGAIVRAYLGLFHERADREVAAAILIDPATTGSWAFALDVRRHIDDPLLRLMAEAASRFAASRAGVGLTRPAFEDLQPRSDAYRTVAAAPVPRTVSTYTFWGDIRVELQAGFVERTVEIGDVALLPGDPDPAALPLLGGQRFLPTGLAPGAEALEIAHRRRVTLGAPQLDELARECVDPTSAASCAEAARALLDVPNAHSNIPSSLDEISVDAAALGGRQTLEDAILAAVARNA